MMMMMVSFSSPSAKTNIAGSVGVTMICVSMVSGVVSILQRNKCKKIATFAQCEGFYTNVCDLRFDESTVILLFFQRQTQWHNIFMF
jgi:hypothetical protein